VRIALIEDDRDVGEIMKAWLESGTHSCHLFTNGKSATREISRESFDLYVIDWQLPDTTGDVVLKFLRETVKHWVPVIFVTSRDSEEDIVTALRMGCDDYMVKPVRRLELLARVDALLRRREPVQVQSVVDFPPYRFETSLKEVVLNEQPVELTEKEFDLALFLFKNQGQLLSRGHISESVWGRGDDVQSRTIDTHVSRLRKKLAVGPEHGYRLSPVYNFGYRLERLPAVATS
jgi:two-component system, OmpR family, response regulator RegX3